MKSLKQHKTASYIVDHISNRIKLISYPERVSDHSPGLSEAQPWAPSSRELTPTGSNNAGGVLSRCRPRSGIKGWTPRFDVRVTAMGCAVWCFHHQVSSRILYSSATGLNYSLKLTFFATIRSLFVTTNHSPITTK